MLLVRAWAEVILASLGAVAAVATAVNPTWFESLFEASPDAGSGAFEWAITLCLALASIGLAVLARRNFRRATV